MPLQSYIIEQPDQEPQRVEIDVPDAYYGDPLLEEDYVLNIHPYLPSPIATEDDDTPLSFLPDWTERGFYRLGQASNVLQEQLGIDSAENAAKDIQDYQGYLQKLPYDPEVQDVLNKLSEAKSAGDWWDAVTSDGGLETLATISGESLAQYLPTIGTGVAVSLFTGLGPVAAFAIGGLPTGLLTTYGTEIRGAMDEFLREETNDPDPLANDQLVIDLLKNEKKMEEFTEFSLKRAIPIAVVDALSFGAAGKLTAAVMKSKKAAMEAGKTGSRLAVPGAVAAEGLAMQPAFGSLGEFAAQTVAGQDINISDILTEGVAEILPGTVEVGVGVALRNRELNKPEPEKIEITTIGAVPAQLKVLEGQSREEELNTVKTMLAANGEEAQAFVNHLVTQIGTGNINEGNFFFRDNIKKIFGFENTKSVDAVLEYLTEQGLVTRPKSKKETKVTLTAKAQQTLNQNTILENQRLEDRKRYYELGQEKGQLKRELKTADGRSRPRILREIKEINDEQQQYKYAATNISPTWFQETKADGSKQLLPEDVSIAEARRMGFIVNPMANEQDAQIIADETGEDVENIIGKPIYRLSDRTPFQSNLQRFLTQQELEKVAEARPFLVPGKRITVIETVLEKLGLKNNREGVPFESSQAIADEYIELKETEALIKEDQGIRSTKNQAIPEGQKTALKNIQDRIKRMENLFKSGLWKREVKAHGITFSTPYYELPDTPSVAAPVTEEAAPLTEIQKLEKEINEILDKPQVTQIDLFEINELRMKIAEIEQDEMTLSRLTNIEVLPDELIEAYNIAREKEKRVAELAKGEDDKIEAYTEEGKRSSGRKGAATRANNKVARIIDRLYPNISDKQRIDIYTQLEQGVYGPPTATVEAAPTVETKPTVDAEPTRQQRIENIQSKFALDDTGYSTLPERIKSPDDVITNDPKLKEFLNARDMVLSADPDSQEQLVTDIKAAQAIAETIDPEQPASQEIDPRIENDVYLEDADDPTNQYFWTVREYMGKREAEQAKEKLKEYLNNKDIPALLKNTWKLGWKVAHPMRLAERYPQFRPAYNFILSRRARREQLNALGFDGTRNLFTNTTRDEYKILSKVAVVLDALGGTKELTISEPDADGNVKITIADEPVKSFDPETGDIIQDISDERYLFDLKMMGVEPGTITLTPRLWSRYTEARQSIDRMFDVVGRAFVRHFLQTAPLYGDIKETQGDTTQDLKNKIKTSIVEYIKDINRSSKISLKDVVDINDLEQNLDTLEPTDPVTRRIEEFQETIKSLKGKEAEALKKKIQIAKEQLNIIKLINNQEATRLRNPYYIPRQRYGNYFFSIVKKGKKGQKPETVYYETAQPFWADTQEKQKNRLRERIKELKDSGLFPEDTYEISAVRDRVEAKDIKGIDTENINIFEELASRMGFIGNQTSIGSNKQAVEKRSTQVEAFFEELKKKITQDGFNKYLERRENSNIVHGYYNPQTADTFLPFATSNYVRTAADTASNLEYYKGLKSAIEGINDKELREAADRLVQNINNPADPGSLAKAVTFQYAIGSNISSAAVNLSQLFTASLPLMKAVLGSVQGKGVARELFTAMKDAVKMSTIVRGDIKNLDKYGFDFPSPTLPDNLKGVFKSQEEYTMIRDLYRKGIVQAISNIDQGSTYNSAIGEMRNVLPENASNNMAKLLQASSFLFGYVEQFNRISTALATYRLAKRSNSNLKKLNDFAQYTAYSTRTTTPAQAAEMMAMKTQFLISKENRPELFHNGIFNVATQFMSFPLQMLGLYAQALSIAKVDKKLGSAMLGGFVVSMFFFAGIMGLPFGENLRQLLRAVSTSIGDKYDFDLKYGIEQALIEAGLSETLAETITMGPLRQLSGIDVSRRIGVGEIIPMDLMNGSLAVAGGPTIGILADSMKRAFDAYNQEDINYARLATSIMPLAIRNAYDATHTMVDKYEPIRTTQGRVLLPNEKLGNVENAFRFLGFTPTTLSEAREQRRLQRFLQGETKSTQDYYLSQLAKSIARSNMAYNEGDMDIYNTQQEIIQDLYKEIQDLNERATADERLDRIVRIETDTLRKRIITEMFGQADPRVALSTTRKLARQQLLKSLNN